MRRLFIPLTALLVVVAACGDAAEPPGDYDTKIEVKMDEFSFDPGSLTVAAGETVRFKVVNKGAIKHEFVVTTKEEAEEHVASGHQGHNEETTGHDENAAEPDHEEGTLEIEVESGKTGYLDVTFHDAGEYNLIACLLPGHYEAGMVADLSVEG